MSVRESVARALPQAYYAARGRRLAEEIRHFAASQWLPHDELKRIQRRQLAALLAHAYRSIPFYKQRFDAVGFQPERCSDVEDLTRIPVTTKDELRAYFSSQQYSTWRKVWCLSSRRTSGSTGTPLVLMKGFKTLSRMDAVMFRNYGWYGIRPGDRQIRLWGSPFGRKRWAPVLKDALLNRKRFSSFNISRDTALRLVGEIARSRSYHLYGYAQTVYQMARLLADMGWRNDVNKPRAIVLTGEMISRAQRDLIETVFASRTVDEYGCTEAGVIAMECPAGRMHLMENLWVEVVKSNGSPSEEVVVTELSRDHFPLIRYRLGDLASIDAESCSCGRGLPILSEFEGRSDDLIGCADGRLVDPYFFEYVISELPSRYGSIHQFKIIQQGHRLRFLLVVSDTFTNDSLDVISARVRSVLGSGTTIAFDVVSSIPKDPSGKLRCFHRIVAASPQS